jgi:hypothetical protein
MMRARRGRRGGEHVSYLFRDNGGEQRRPCVPIYVAVLAGWWRCSGRGGEQRRRHGEGGARVERSDEVF